VNAASDKATRAVRPPLDAARRSGGSVAYRSWQLFVAPRGQPCARRSCVATKPAPRPVQSTPARGARYTLTARALRYRAMSAAFVLIIVVALLCIAMLVLFGVLWAALHFGVGHDDDD
jgi:hypothetical protein